MLMLIKYLVIAALLKFSYDKAADFNGKVSGRLFTQEAVPLKNKVVSLASDSLVIRFTRTNEKGYFAFDKIPSGNYRILIAIPGYKRYVLGLFCLTTTTPFKACGDIKLETSK